MQKTFGFVACAQKHYLDTVDLGTLRQLAKNASLNAYDRHSRFKVGCAILTESGNAYAGCNVESDSLIFTICAERNAISTAITAEGNIRIKQLVIYTPTEKPTPPCGSCRQLIFEFGLDTQIVSYCEGKEATYTIRDLLPEAFDAKKILG
jgi:cytidine deaminase